MIRYLLKTVKMAEYRPGIRKKYSDNYGSLLYNKNDRKVNIIFCFSRLFVNIFVSFSHFCIKNALYYQ